jgi:hypothetical protein
MILSRTRERAGKLVSKVSSALAAKERHGVNLTPRSCQGHGSAQASAFRGQHAIVPPHNDGFLCFKIKLLGTWSKSPNC